LFDHYIYEGCKAHEDRAQAWGGGGVTRILTSTQAVREIAELVAKTHYVLPQIENTTNDAVKVQD
jgi:hypothetical protein